MTAISAFCQGLYLANVFEGDKLVATIKAATMQQLRAKVKAVYGVNIR